MTNEDLKTVLELIGAETKGDWQEFPEGRTATFQVAKQGVGFSVSRATALRQVGKLLQVRTTKDETCVMELNDVFACMVDAAVGQTSRRAGFA